MTPLPVLVLGIGIVRYQSIGYWVLGVQLGIVLTLHHTVALAKLLTPLCPVTKQHNLVPGLPAKGMIFLAGKVTVGLVESNGSLPPGL